MGVWEMNRSYSLLGIQRLADVLVQAVDVGELFLRDLYGIGLERQADGFLPEEPEHAPENVVEDRNLPQGLEGRPIRRVLPGSGRDAR